VEGKSERKGMKMDYLRFSQIECHAIDKNIADGVVLT